MSTTTDPLDAHVDALRDALAALARGEEPADEPAELFDAALNAARGQAPRDPFLLSMPAIDLIPENLRRLRQEAGLSQAGLADAMAALGFPWSRPTVAEAERRTDPEEQDPRLPKRLTFEEMVGVAVLFGVPVVELWRVPPGVQLTFEAAGLRDATPTQVAELVVGRRGVVGEGGPTWAAASAIDPEVEIERPARRLWRTRRAQAKGGK